MRRKYSNYILLFQINLFIYLLLMAAVGFPLVNYINFDQEKIMKNLIKRVFTLTLCILFLRFRLHKAE